MAKSYIIKVSDLINRPDANVIKYWVDSYSLVSYRGDSNVYKVIIGGIQLLIVDPDRINWDVVEIDETSILKRSDYPYFKMDKYLYKGISQALELRSAFIDNEYIGYEATIHIQDASACDVNKDGSVINAALRVEGGGYFGKNIKVRERSLIGEVEAAPYKFGDIDTAEHSVIKALCTISNPGADAVVDSTYSLTKKGAAYIDGGLSVSRNIVGLGNEFISGDFNVKGDISTSVLNGIVPLGDCSRALIVYNSGLYTATVPVRSVEFDMESKSLPYHYHYTTSKVIIPAQPAQYDACGGVVVPEVPEVREHTEHTVNGYTQISYIVSQFKGYGLYKSDIIIDTPDNKSVCTAQLQNVTLLNKPNGVLHTSLCEVVSGNKVKVTFIVFNSDSGVGYSQNITYGIRYTLTE